VGVKAPPPHPPKIRYYPSMRDRYFYPLAAVLAVGMVLLALVWPQGQGARSPAPFGHEPQTPAKAAGLRPAQ